MAEGSGTADIIGGLNGNEAVARDGTAADEVETVIVGIRKAARHPLRQTWCGSRPTRRDPASLRRFELGSSGRIFTGKLRRRNGLQKYGVPGVLVVPRRDELPGVEHPLQSEGG